MSFQDDQRAEILRLTAQMSSEFFHVLDTGPGTVGLAEMEELKSCPPSHGGGWKVTLKCREWGQWEVSLGSDPGRPRMP